MKRFKSERLTEYLTSECQATIADLSDAWLHFKHHHIEDGKYFVDQMRNDTKINCIYSNNNNVSAPELRINDYHHCCDSYKRNHNDIVFINNISNTEEITMQQKLDGIHEYIFHGSSTKFDRYETSIVTTDDDQSGVTTRSAASSLESIGTGNVAIFSFLSGKSGRI